MSEPNVAFLDELFDITIRTVGPLRDVRVEQVWNSDYPTGAVMLTNAHGQEVVVGTSVDVREAKASADWWAMHANSCINKLERMRLKLERLVDTKGDV